MCQNSSDCAVMTETAAINTKFSFRVPDLVVSDITSIPTEQQECGMVYQLTGLTFLQCESKNPPEALAFFLQR